MYPDISISRRNVFRLTTATLAPMTFSSPLFAQAADCNAIVSSRGYLEKPSVYFESTKPAQPTGKPTLILIHGGGHTGSCYLTTPDGRPGWAQLFVRSGYPVVVPDWPGIGRSGHVRSDMLTGELVCAGLGNVIASINGPVVILTHSMSGPYGWKLLEDYGRQIVKVVAIAPGPPGNIQPLPRVVRETSEIIEIEGTTNFTLNRGAPFVASIGFVKGKLIGKSARFPHLFTDSYAASLVAVPPRLVQQRLNIGGSQLKVTDTANYKGKPVLIVTGTDDVDHPRDLDEAVANWAKSAGAVVDFWFLSDKGVNGNGHMMMLEDNSDQLATMIADWIGS